MADLQDQQRVEHARRIPFSKFFCEGKGAVRRSLADCRKNPLWCKVRALQAEERDSLHEGHGFSRAVLSRGYGGFRVCVRTRRFRIGSNGR